MPPRLAHRKSRNGCQRCKARRVKCGEERPICGACARHNVPCQYSSIGRDNDTISEGSEFGGHEPGPTALPDVESSSKLSSASSPFFNIDSPYSDFVDIDLPETTERRLIELHLLHHYMQIVPTFPSSFDPPLREVNFHQVPQIAIRYPYLMNTIFALAALHLLYESGSERCPIQPEPDWSTIHRTYLNLAVRQQREAISELCSQNAEAVCHTSIFLAYQSFKLIPPDHSTRRLATASGRAEYQPPIQWFSLSTAIQTVVSAAWSLLPTGSGILLLLTSRKPQLTRPWELMDPCNRDIPQFQVFLDFDSYPEYNAGFEQIVPLEKEAIKAYESALSYCGTVYKAIFETHEPRLSVARRIFAFGALCPIEYRHLMQERRPRALVILALFCAMMKYTEDLWWFKGRADAEMNGIEPLVRMYWGEPVKWIRSVMDAAATVSPNESPTEQT